MSRMRPGRSTTARTCVNPKGLRKRPRAADDGLVRLPFRSFPPFVATRRLIGTIPIATLAALVFAASPAGAIVTTVGSTQAGYQPRSTSLQVGYGADAETFANPTGNPILPASKVYAIYWDPTDHYHGDWQQLIDTFLQGMGGGSGSLASVFAVDAQYTDAANQHALYKSTLMGAFTDTQPYPTSGNCTDPHPLSGESYPGSEPDAITCLTDAQLRGQLENFVFLHGLAKGMNTIFYILTPPGVTVCLDAGSTTGHCSSYAGSPGSVSYENSFCSYHSDINPDAVATGDGNTLLYAAIPWTAGGLDDGHLGGIDQTPAYDCQDGGYDPSSKPIEKLEQAPEKNKKQEEEFDEKSGEEKAKQERSEALAGPHQQEPNQGACPGPDGFCDTGLADLVVNQIAVEQQNIVTDPLLNAWKDDVGNEATDECRDFFASTEIGGGVTANEETSAGTLFNQALGGLSYYLNDAFNLAALNLPYPAVPCMPGVVLDPKFTAPNPVNAGELAGFDGMESNITLNWGTAYAAGTPKPTYAFYTWNFGDGSPTVSGFAPGATPNSPGQIDCAAPWESPCAASEFHSFQYGGTYDVTLTVADTGGNTATFTQPIAVDGPPRPAPVSPGPPGSSSGGTPGATTGAGATGAGSTPGAATKPPVPGPVATQAIMSSSRSKALSKGLVVRYSVSQQAAGHFEVLLAASLAHRIGLHAPLATGLPQGTAPQVVIAKALLVTTKAGRSTLKIQFGKVTAKRLRRLHQIPLLLRLNLRNAGGGTTTVLSKLTLR